MKIRTVSVSRCLKGKAVNSDIEGVCHKKALQWLSVVQSVEGHYDVKIGNGKTYHTEEGGFFVAPSLQHQSVTHHVSEKSGRMVFRWVFLEIRINEETRLEDLCDIPVLLPDAYRHRMNDVFEKMFASDDPFDEALCGIEIAKILYEVSEGLDDEKRKKIADKRMASVLALIEERYYEKITVEMLAKEVNLSESRFYAAFKKLFGISPIKYVNDFRLSKAEQMLLFTDRTVGEIASSVGIDDGVYFNKLFKNRYHLAPSEYRKRNMG